MLGTLSRNPLKVRGIHQILNHLRLKSTEGRCLWSAVVCQSYAIANAVGYAKFYSRSHDAVIGVFDLVGNTVDTHEHAGDFKEP